MYRFELVAHKPGYEEYVVLLSAGVPRKIVEPVIVSTPDEKMQEVGRWILSRGPSDDDPDSVTVIAHPDLSESERLLLLKQIEGICGKHIYGIGSKFEKMLVLSEELCPWHSDSDERPSKKAGRIKVPRKRR